MILNVSGGGCTGGCYNGDDARPHSERHRDPFNKRQKGNDQYASSQSKKRPDKSGYDGDEEND